MDLKHVPITEGKYSCEVMFEREYYEKMDIVDILPVKVDYEITKDINQDYYLNLVTAGKMLLNDAITLDIVEYPFSFEINAKIDESDEQTGLFIEKFKNSLDIMSILWENIVLEVPISYSVSNGSNEEHEGWELIREEKKEIDPRLAPLLELFNEEKE